MARTKNSKKTARNIPHEVEERIGKVSLQNPDYGARRLLPLLEQEGITVTASAVYTILKRNNLQNRSLRIAKLEEQRTAEIVPKPAATTDPPAVEQAPVPAHTDEATAPHRVSSVMKFPSKTRDRRPWSLNPLNILLLGLVGYFWVSAIGNLLEARREPLAPHDSTPVAVESIPLATVRPLEDYSIIYERNLFGDSTGQASSPQEDVSLELIPTAEKSLGLKLVGTVAGDDPATSFAIIDNNTTRKQELYHEGDKAGEVLIKRILRNNVIVNAGRGDEVLTLELQESGKRLEFPGTPHLADMSPPAAAREKVESRRVPGRHHSVQLDRAAVAVALSDKNRVMEEATLTPYTVYDRASGLKITNIEPDSIFAKLGLRNGDVIKDINDVAIAGPEQATQLFQALREGGDITIKVKGKRRGRQIHLTIE